MGREIVYCSRASAFRAKRGAQPGEPNETPRVHYAARRCGGVPLAKGNARELLTNRVLRGSSTPSAMSQCVAAFVHPGRTVAIEYRWAEGRCSRAAAMFPIFRSDAL